MIPNRPMQVTVWELCPVCNELKKDMKEREYWRFWTKRKLVSCEDCFKEKQADDADYDNLMIF